MGQKTIRKREIRVSQDAVTHAREVVVLDDVRLAFERIIQTVDREMLKLPDTAQRNRLAVDVIDRVRAMLPHEDVE